MKYNAETIAAEDAAVLARERGGRLTLTRDEVAAILKAAGRLRRLQSGRFARAVKASGGAVVSFHRASWPPVGHRYDWEGVPCVLPPGERPYRQRDDGMWVPVTEVDRFYREASPEEEIEIQFVELKPSQKDLEYAAAVKKAEENIVRPRRRPPKEPTLRERIHARMQDHPDDDIGQHADAFGLSPMEWLRERDGAER